MEWIMLFSNLLSDMLIFLASIVGSVLSWPVAIVVVVIIFNRPIRGLIGRIRTVKGAGLDVELREEILDAETAALQAREAAARERPDVESTVARDETPIAKADAEGAGGSGETRASVEDVPAGLIRLHGVPPEESSWTSQIPVSLASNPRALIDYAWRRLTKRLSELYFRVSGGSSPMGVRPWRMAAYLSTGALVDEAFVESVKSLQEVRDEIASSDEDAIIISAKTARAFARTAAKLQAIVEAHLESSTSVSGRYT